MSFVAFPDDALSFNHGTPYVGPMSLAYDAGQRTALQRAAALGQPLRCPVCDVALSEQQVNPKPELPYVRRRLWLLCPHCRRSASIDLPHK